MNEKSVLDLRMRIRFFLKKRTLYRSNHSHVSYPLTHPAPSYNQLQKYLRHCTVFWHKWPVHDLVLVFPLPPLIKVVSNTRPYSKLGGTTLNGREEGVQYYILPTCDQERFEARKVVFRGSVSSFLQLVVATSTYNDSIITTFLTATHRPPC